MHPALGERTRDKDEIIAELREALDIVAALNPPEPLMLATFGAAVQGVTQRAARNLGNGVVLAAPGPNGA